MQHYNCVLVYTPDEQSILVCKRTSEPYKGLYNLVGGKREPGETGFAAAYRELFEETGITNGDITLLHMMDFTYYNEDCVVEVYAGTLRGEPVLKPEKHPLHYLPVTEDFFSLARFAGEGNIGHMLEVARLYGKGVPQEQEERS